MQLDKEMFFKVSAESVFQSVFHIYENVSDSGQLEFITQFFSQELFPFMKVVLLFQLNVSILAKIPEGESLQVPNTSTLRCDIA